MQGEQGSPGEGWVAVLAALVSPIGQVLEFLGVAVIVTSIPVALVISVLRSRRGDLVGWYTHCRRLLGRGILLGLELLVGADIIRTVGHVPELLGVITLAIVVLVRTLLSFTLEVELEGRWPWRRAERGQAESGAP